MESFTHYLKNLRERDGLSQIELSKKAALSETYYGKIEGGERRPSASVLLQILSQLACSAEEQYHALRLFAMERFPLAFVDGLTTRPQSGTAAGSVVPSRKRQRTSTRRRTKLAAWLFAAASGTALGQPLAVEAARPITVHAAPAPPSRGILSRSRRLERLDEAA